MGHGTDQEQSGVDFEKALKKDKCYWSDFAKSCVSSDTSLVCLDLISSGTNGTLTTTW